MIVCAAALLAGCGASDESSSSATSAIPDGAPYSYDVPDGFTTIPSGESTGSVGTATDKSTIALDDVNIIQLSVFELKTEVTEANLEDARKELDAAVATAAKQGGIGTVPKSEAVRIAGAPAFKYRIEGVPIPSGKPATNISYAVLKGFNQIQVLCQYTPDKQAEVERGCDTVLASLTLT